MIRPDWPAPEHVTAFTSTRLGGVSEVPYLGLNTATHVGDQFECVSKNRDALQRYAHIPSDPIWLNQTHSTRVVDLTRVTQNTKNIAEAQERIASEAYDASYCVQANIPCVVQTADCLPILLCDRKGTWIAAVHAGWRGLLDGIIEKTLSQFQGDTQHLLAWIGPCIRQANFAVGAELKEQFVNKNKNYERYFAKQEQQLFADLAGIATYVLKQNKVMVFDSQRCSYGDSKQFYSYRRDGVTGRMATAIWME